MADLTPKTRIEYYLAKANGQDVPVPQAATRLEMYLRKIAGEEQDVPTPVTRLEMFLAKIAGEDVTTPTPVTRLEMFLDKVAGGSYDDLVAVTRLEMWLDGIQGGETGEQKTASGTAPLSFTALAHALISLTQYGKIAQASTPTPSAPKDIVCNNGTLKMLDDELPPAYKRVLGFTCDNNAMWEITDFHLKGSDTVRISFSVTAACNVFGCYQGADADDNYDLYASISAGSKYFRYGSGTYLSYFSNDNLGQRFDVVFTPNGSTGMPQDSTWTPKTFTSANNLLIGSTTLTGTSSKLKGDLYGNIIVEQSGVERLHLVPCERTSDNVLGYYDLVGEAFYEPYTGYTGAVSLGYDGSHYDLAIVGTAEVLTVSGTHDSRLPSGYTPCEYISASGTDEYINTGIVINAIGTDVEVDFKYDGEMTGTPKMLWGYMGSSSNLPRWGFGVYTNKWLGSPNGTASVGTSDNTDRHAAVMRVFRTSNDTEVYSGTMDGTELYASNNLGNTSLFTENTLPLILFGRNNNGTAGNLAEAKIYGFKVTENGTVTHELVPCLNAESEAGFYDLITHEFHGNEGTTQLGYAIKYTPNGTASVQNLYAVGDYKDTQEIIRGTVTRRVVVRVMTGAETSGWSRYSTNQYRFVPSDGANTKGTSNEPSKTHILCNRYKEKTSGTPRMYTMNSSSAIVFQDTDVTEDTIDAYKEKVAAWYASGEPLIVIYPLATATTEQVTAQSLHTTAGENVVSVVSNVDPVTLEAVYMGEASDD